MYKRSPISSSPTSRAKDSEARIFIQQNAKTPKRIGSAAFEMMTTEMDMLHTDVNNFLVPKKKCTAAPLNIHDVMNRSRRIMQRLYHIQECVFSARYKMTPEEKRELFVIAVYVQVVLSSDRVCDHIETHCIIPPHVSVKETIQDTCSLFVETVSVLLEHQHEDK